MVLYKPKFIYAFVPFTNTASGQKNKQKAVSLVKSLAVIIIAQFLV